MSNAPKKSIPRPGRKPTSEPAPAVPTQSTGKAPPASQQIALLAARAGLDKKATGVEIIDVTGKVDYADYLVLMTGASDRNVAAIAHEVDGALAKAGFRSMSVEGLPAAQWVLIDFVDVVVHVFQKDVRSLYDLDGLWMDAERLPMQGAADDPDSDDDFVVESPAPKLRAKTGKRPTKKAKTTASKATVRRAGSAASSSARNSTRSRTAGSRAASGTSGASRGTARSSAAKPVRKAKASRGAK